MSFMTTSTSAPYRSRVKSWARWRTRRSGRGTAASR